MSEASQSIGSGFDWAATPLAEPAPRRVSRATVDNEARWVGLMAAAQDGDGAAYAALLRDCLPFIRMVVAGAGVGGAAVDDVVQEVLLAVHRARHTFDPARPFTPWLRVIAQRRAIDTLRSSMRRGGRELHAPEAFEAHPDPAPIASITLGQADDGVRLHAAVAGLPQGQREAVELLGLQELTLEEASVRSGRSKTALKVNLHRAIKALRTRMGSDG